MVNEKNYLVNQHFLEMSEKRLILIGLLFVVQRFIRSVNIKCSYSYSYVQICFDRAKLECKLVMIPRCPFHFVHKTALQYSKNHCGNSAKIILLYYFYSFI